MRNDAYALLPCADLHGNMGGMGPGERESRYKPFVEKQRLFSCLKEEE